MVCNHVPGTRVLSQCIVLRKCGYMLVIGVIFRKCPEQCVPPVCRQFLMDEECAESEASAKAGVQRRKTLEISLLLIPSFHVRGKQMDNLIFRM